MVNEYIKGISNIVWEMGNLLSKQEETFDKIKEEYVNGFNCEELVHSSETGGKLASNKMFETKDFDYFDQALQKIKEIV